MSRVLILFVSPFLLGVTTIIHCFDKVLKF